jgi:tetratricopeptide (TPR) repeat protein
LAIERAIPGMRIFRKTPAAAIAMVAFLFAGTAWADDATELDSARASYDGGRYDEGVVRFREILNPASPHALKSANAIERARAYFAACLIALERFDEANEQFEKILRQNPRFKPDPVVFPRQVTDRFYQVQSKLKGEIEAADRVRAEAREKAEKDQRAYITTLQRMAGHETVVVKNSRWLAAVPFGVGQFQNGQPGLGYAFLISEALLAGTSITAGVIHMQLVSDYSRSPTSIDYEDFVSRKDAMFRLSVYSTAALAVVAIGGIVQAQIEYVPETRLEPRPRPLPPPPPVVPTVGAIDSGVLFGVQGRF